MCALQTGERLQRFWLTATQLGLAVQPTLAILAFADHGIRGTAFTHDEQLRGRARLLGERASSALGELGVVRFIGRIGKRRHGLPGPRSVRKSLQDLMWQPPSALGESGSAIG